MNGAAHSEEVEETGQVELAATGTDGVAANLRQVASERLAEHRQRRGSPAQQPVPESDTQRRNGRSGAAKVREAVAARYQNSVSYREFLAQEAERALEQAQAEVEVATRNARAVAEAQMQLLEELQQWTTPQPAPREVALAEQAAHTRDELAHAMADIAVAATQAMHLQPQIEFAPEQCARGETPRFTVRLYEELDERREDSPRFRDDLVQHDEREVRTLDEEIAFRFAPEFEQRGPAPVAIAGNVIEFPRPLVAPRKARPRRAEGPLLEESAPQPQLRIFEVEPEQISEAPVETTSAPQWQGVLLEEASAEDAAEPMIAPDLIYALQPQVAAMSLRMMALGVDVCCVLGASVAFSAVAVRLAGDQMSALARPMLGVTAGVSVLVLAVAYQLLFFTLSDATPGMRYARIALCTFGDRNPTRQAMRRRVLATLLAACPMGLGLLWAWMDEERMGWHDRMSRMYQRGY